MKQGRPIGRGVKSVHNTSGLKCQCGTCHACKVRERARKKARERKRSEHDQTEAVSMA
jgi:7-cyano-7-deazaguanine synthase in queuosine biosynthesis